MEGTNTQDSSLNNDLSEEDLDDHQRDYWTDKIVRSMARHHDMYKKKTYKVCKSFFRFHIWSLY
jgi:hypothetical protein